MDKANFATEYFIVYISKFYSKFIAFKKGVKIEKTAF